MEEIFGKSYNLETALIERGFILDAEYERRSSYRWNNLFAHIYWTGNIVTPDGISNGFGVKWLHKDDFEYLDHRPKNDIELDLILKKAGFEK